MSTSVNDVKAVSTKRAVFGKLKATVVLGDDGITYIQRSHAVKGLKVISQTFVYQINKLTGSAGVAIQMDDELPRESWRKFVSVSHINDYCRLLAKSNSHKKQANPEFVKWINGTVFFEPTSFDDTFNNDTPAQTFGSLDDGKMHLVGIAGLARAGKDTLASYMLDNLDGAWLRSSFADPIKEMLRAIGVDCSDDAKAVIDDSYGVTPRHMMQVLGTEWGRHMIDGDIWVKAFARLNAGKCVIVPDVRFGNEADLVREHGVLIHLVGRGGINGSHVSENAIEFKTGDIVIDNSRDMAWLMSQVDGHAVLSEFIAGVSA